MKKLWSILIIFTLFASCKVREKPVFVGVEKIKIIDANKRKITVSANAIFENPNDVGGSLETEDISIFVNNKRVASVSAETFKVPKRNNFSIPLKVNIPTDSVFNKNNLSGILNSLLNKDLQISYKGNIDYKIMGYKSSYKIDKTETVKIKL